jgi:hypothetical protein
MVIGITLLVALLGLVIWFASTTNAKLAEAGRLLFFAGILAALLNKDAILHLIG